MDTAPERLRDWVIAGAHSSSWLELELPEDAVIRARVALNLATPPELLVRPVNDQAWFVRWAVASHPDLDVEHRDKIFGEMATDARPTLRLIAAGDSSCPSHVLQILAQDPGNVVRSLATESLSESRAEPANTTPSGVRRARLEWSVGEVGPAGGVIFFDAGSRQWWGRYLEAAPDGWSLHRNELEVGLDPAVAWCEDEYWSSSQREIDTQDDDVLDAWCLSFRHGSPDVCLKTNECTVRPVRAF